MQLKQKGSAANVGGFRQLMVTMRWTTATDFDLAAAYEAKDRRRGLVYYGDMGDLNAFPYMQLSGDAGIDDTVDSGGNEETMLIARLDDMKYVWILCWDYEEVKVGRPARFEDSDVVLSVVDDQGSAYDVTLEAGARGNVAHMATIDNSSPVGARLVNASNAGTLNGLRNLSQLLGIIRA